MACSGIMKSWVVRIGFEAKPTRRAKMMRKDPPGTSKAMAMSLKMRMSFEPWESKMSAAWLA